MFKKIAAILAFAALFAYSAVNYPYPQRKLYGNGTINVVNSTADADLKKKFENYIKDFYVVNPSNSAQARIKFYDPDKAGDADYTVSEGIGYAMIMAVYFSDATTSYQSHFDKLWAYYNAHKNSNGVMHWKINGFGNADQQNGATDAELDVALALAMARYQFGDTKYETDAKALIDIIWNKEVSSGGLLKPGDAWDTDRNPSYVSPAAFAIFSGFGSSTASNWSTALSTNYTFLKNNQNGSTGLPSDWASDNGSPKQCTACGYTGQNYGQDAVRAPWRWALSKAWFNHADAETLLAKLATWVNGKNATDIKGPISLTGTMGSNSNSAYLGSLMCALTHKSTYQSKLNSFFSTMIGKTDLADGSYFNQSMQILTGLLVSGNMPNLKACAAGNCGTNMTVIDPNSGDNTLLDRLSSAGGDSEEDRSLSALWEAWFAYTDKDADGGKGGKSTITNVQFKAKDENDNCKEIDSYRVVLQEGSDWAVKIPSYTLDKGTYAYAPFVALGLNARKNGTSAAQGGYNLSSCTGGFSYQYKGSAHRFKVLSKDIVPDKGSDHFKNITTASTSSWATAIILPDELTQPTWVTAAADKVDFSLAKIRGWAWELEGAATSGGTALSATTGSLAIKDFKCLGKMTLPDYTAPTCGGGTPPSSSSAHSSSSVGSSSSSGGGSSSSARSSSSGGGTSSSSGSTPIVLPQIVLSNSLISMQNSVNLQVTNDASLKIFDLNGNIVRSFKFTKGNYIVSLADLPRGLYIVKAGSVSWKQTLKVVR